MSEITQNDSREMAAEKQYIMITKEELDAVYGRNGSKYRELCRLFNPEQTKTAPKKGSLKNTFGPVQPQNEADRAKTN